MTDLPDVDAFEPNRVRITGETEANVIALSVRVEPDAIIVQTRTGTVSSEQVTLPYDSLESVHIVRDATYTVVFETERREYALTNLSPDRGAVGELVDYVRDRGGLRTERQSNGSTTESQADTDVQTEQKDPATEPEGKRGQGGDQETETELDEWTWGETSGTN
jgi:hypothetical protein